MPEPITIGAFVVCVLVKIAEGGAAELAKGAVSEAYATLKGKVAQWAGPKVEVLEAAPDSDKVRREIAETIDTQNAVEQALVKALADAVIAKGVANTGRSLALDFADLRNVTVNIKEIDAVGNATGARMSGVEGGAINVDRAKAEGSYSK